MSDKQQLRLRYFPFAGRAGPIRDALRIGRIAFEDVHIPPQEFRERRAAGEFPFGGLPVMDIQQAGSKLCVAQSNAILRYVGRLADLYPDDPLQALKVDEALDMGEDVNHMLGPSMHEQDMQRKLEMRKKLVAENLPFWAACFERLLEANGNTGFIVSDRLSVADLKLFWVVDTLTNGTLDGIPTDLLDAYAGIVAWRNRVAEEREARLPEQAVA